MATVARLGGAVVTAFLYGSPPKGEPTGATIQRRGFLAHPPLGDDRGLITHNS
jgi:hypothetical protein